MCYNQNIPKAQQKEVSDLNIDYGEIRKTMWKNKVSMSKVARELDISTSTLSRKLSGQNEFTVSEAVKLCDYLNLNPTNIFFAERIPNTQQ